MAGPTALPSGIVTFVFTDIEGSTRLLRRLGDRYSILLDRHLDLMQAAWDAHGGHVVDTAGDGVFLAFQDADDAVNACAMAQRRLTAEPWPADAQLRARMGLHTGLAAPAGGDYRALAVHQAERVMSSAHGGQVLLSAVTMDRLSALDPATMVVPLGRFRVRDFDQPVRLFQLAGEGLPSEFPAVRALPADGSNLVRPATSFVGRDGELADVIERLGPGRLVTLAGPGGVGKTRLATHVGLTVSDRWPDGAWFVDLSTVDQPDLIPLLVAEALGVPGRGDDRWKEVLDHLADKQALLILDNCEGTADGCARLLEELLAGCPACGALATSRVALRTAREDLWRVEPLDISDPDGGYGAAVDLFLDRLAPRRREEVIASGREDTVAEICRRLDGLPLAVELAAARLAVVSPEELLEGLRDRFRVLRSNDPTAPERQRSLEALLDWSDRLLEAGERACLHRLGVFAGTFSVDSATAAVAGGAIDAYDVPELVWSLIDKSLVTADLTSSATRYRLLESVREFALRRLEDENDTVATSTRLAAWFNDRLGPTRRHDPTWLSDLRVEVDNLRSLVETVGPVDATLAQELVFTIARYHDGIESYREAIAVLQQSVKLASIPTPAAISLHTTRAFLHLRLADATQAKLALAEAEALYDEVGSLPAWDDAAIERTRGDLACRSGDYATALDAATRALAAELSDASRAGMCNQLGIASLALGDVDGAAVAFAQELEACRRLGDPAREMAAVGNLAETDLRRDDTASAAAHQRACLLLALEIGAPAMVAFSLIVAARLEAKDQRWDDATALHSQAESILDATGLVLYEDDQRESDAMLEAARHALGDAGYGAARQSGHALELPEAAAMAGDVLARHAAPNP